jgi:hypothetical protein
MKIRFAAASCKLLIVSAGSCGKLFHWRYLPVTSFV